jgi:L-aminopeptidase/D-esterase-like protein
VSDERVTPGLGIGHATDVEARTGCTVLLGPFSAAVHVTGLATGSRELDTLSPLHLAPFADALLLTGGSAFGLAAADGVSAWLEARGRGFDAGVARVPIVPAAVIFDLGVGRADRRPDAAMGFAACQAAEERWPEQGRVGAGAGASVGKLLGAAGAGDGGFGCAGLDVGGFALTAVAVVHALGDVLGDDGRIIAGARLPDGSFAGSARLLREGSGVPAPDAPLAGTNTTLAAVVIDAPLDRPALLALARMAATALARRIEPVNTPFDGDIVFAASTFNDSSPPARDPAQLLRLGAAAAYALGLAIERAVTSA